MSIERSQTTQHTDPTDRAGNDGRDARAREPAPPDKADKFKRLMEAKHEQGETRSQSQAAKQDGAAIDSAAAERQALAERHEEPGLRRQRDDAGTPLNLQMTDASTQFQAQMAVREGLPQTAPAPLNATAFADMMEKHLKQLAVDRGDAGDGRVLLRMSDATLPGTDLLLSKTADGWQLRADVRSRSSYDAIQDAAPALAKRFAERNLGTLSIDPHFHG